MQRCASGVSGREHASQQAEALHAQPWMLKLLLLYGSPLYRGSLLPQSKPCHPAPDLLACHTQNTHHTTPAGSSRGTVPDPRDAERQHTMWVIMATALPGYLPSVLRGDRLRKLAPARWATAWQTEVFPVRGAPYRSTALAQGSLQGGTLLSLEHPVSPPRQPQALPVLSGQLAPWPGAYTMVQQCRIAQQHRKAQCLQQAEPWARCNRQRLRRGESRLYKAAAALGPVCMSAALCGAPVSCEEQQAESDGHLAGFALKAPLPGSLATTGQPCGSVQRKQAACLSASPQGTAALTCRGHSPTPEGAGSTR